MLDCDWSSDVCSSDLRWEKKIENYTGLLHFVCGIIAFRAAQVYG
jgi:hypothetical protein